MVVPEVKITKMVILFFFSKETRLKNNQFIHKIRELWTFVWPFCNWQKCGYSSNVQIKYMYCFLLQIFMFQLSSALTPKLQIQPRFHNQCQPGPIWGIRSPLLTSLHLLIDCIETSGVVGHLDSGWRGRGIFYFLL